MPLSTAQLVELEIRTNRENAEMFDSDIRDFNKVMAWSAFFQEVGVQAAFAAATLGASAWLASSPRMIAAGEWLAGLGAESATAARAIGFTVKVARLGRAAAPLGGEGAALTGVMSRAVVGLTVLAIRRLSGDLGTKPPLNSKGLGSAFLITLLMAWVGGPGAPSANSGALKALIERFPTIVTPQGGAQLTLDLYTGVLAWMRQAENRAFMQFVNSNRMAFNDQLRQLAQRSNQALFDWALQAQNKIAHQVALKAGQIDYSQQMPFFARHFDFVGNAQALQDMSVNAAVYHTKLNFWTQIRDRMQEAQKAVEAAQAMGG
jgi:hypothetical protein